jgi:hypothetical protein
MVANPMTRQDLVGNIKAIAESALLFAESRADERLKLLALLAYAAVGTCVRSFGPEMRQPRSYRARESSPIQ